MIKIRKAEGDISEMFPEFEMSRKWNRYSFFVAEDITRFTVVREPNTRYKVRAAVILPFIFVPYCFYYGWVNVKRAIWESFHGCWACLACTDPRAYDKVMEIYVKRAGKNERIPRAEREVQKKGQ